MKKSLFTICIISLMAMLAQPSNAQWSTSISKDEMTGESTAYANSNSVSPQTNMNFPYGAVRAWLGIGCDGESEWVYIGFTESPNLNNTTNGDGYNEIDTRIKWDDEIEYTSLIQNWGAEFIHFTNDMDAIEKIAKSSTVLLELDWYGEGKVYFRFSLKGSSAAISKIRASCGKKQ